MFASSNAIMEVDVDTQKVTEVVKYGGSYVYSLDYDYDNRYVYFPRQNFNDIVRFRYPSLNITLQNVVNTSYSPEGVAVDSANDHVYWVDDSNRLSRCNSDGKNIVVLVTSFSPAFMIRLDVTNRWMYIGYVHTGIYKSRFDLTDNSVIVTFSQRIGLKKTVLMTYSGEIKSVNEDGSDVKTIISTHSVSTEYYAIGVLDNHIYYADKHQLVIRNKSQGSTRLLYIPTATPFKAYTYLIQ
ncbi:APOER2 [Mytilus edulis]|uniref:LRP8 n=1 Tax=Mytilus edulis TaxID=6550 RepID=A0A8S3VGD8_MYTED|nr:APOER2 [Mytilus edulis]